MAKVNIHDTDRRSSYYCTYCPSMFKFFKRNSIVSFSRDTMMMMNCFCGMVDRRKAFSPISNRDHCQRSSPSQISHTLRAGFEPAQNLSSGLVE